jgi:hypothetical protein
MLFQGPRQELQKTVNRKQRILALFGGKGRKTCGNKFPIGNILRAFRPATRFAPRGMAFFRHLPLFSDCGRFVQRGSFSCRSSRSRLFRFFRFSGLLPGFALLDVFCLRAIQGRALRLDLRVGGFLGIWRESRRARYTGGTQLRKSAHREYDEGGEHDFLQDETRSTESHPLGGLIRIASIACILICVPKHDCSSVGKPRCYSIAIIPFFPPFSSFPFLERNFQKTAS